MTLQHAVVQCTPEVSECHRISGDDRFLLKMHVPAIEAPLRTPSTASSCTGRPAALIVSTPCRPDPPPRVKVRTGGASTALVVIGHTVIDAVASNRSSWTITTGRGLPVYAPRDAVVTVGMLQRSW